MIWLIITVVVLVVGWSSVPTPPAPLDDASDLTSSPMAKAQRAPGNQLHGQALADASPATLEEEIPVLEYGTALAGQSATKQELIAQHVERLAAINNRRITRRFE